MMWRLLNIYWVFSYSLLIFGNYVLRQNGYLAAVMHWSGPRHTSAAFLKYWSGKLELCSGNQAQNRSLEYSQHPTINFNVTIKGAVIDSNPITYLSNSVNVSAGEKKTPVLVRTPGCVNREPENVAQASQIQIQPMWIHEFGVSKSVLLVCGNILCLTWLCI